MENSIKIRKHINNPEEMIERRSRTIDGNINHAGENRSTNARVARLFAEDEDDDFEVSQIESERTAKGIGIAETRTARSSAAQRNTAQRNMVQKRAGSTTENISRVNSASANRASNEGDSPVRRRAAEVSGSNVSNNPVRRKRKKKKKTAIQKIALYFDIKKILLLAIMVVALGVFIFALVNILKGCSNYEEASNSYEEVQDYGDQLKNLKKKISKTNTNTTVVSDENGEVDIEETPLTMQEIFAELRAINPEVIGYIMMQGEGDDIVDYPVVQTYNNDFYLTHLFDETHNNAGAIFMDCEAYDGFASTYAIIYGHNMQAGSRMFGCLGNYKNEEYFLQHPMMDIYTENYTYTYKVFAAFVADIGGFVYDTSSWNYGSAYDYAAMAIAETPYDMGTTVDDLPEDLHILTLSTCLDTYVDEYRYVVLMYRCDTVENETTPAADEGAADAGTV